MNLPENTSLPFFAYGIFKQGQISYFTIRDHVENIKIGTKTKGLLLIRDGIPLIDLSIHSSYVTGDLICFKENEAVSAYKNIAALEPDSQYKWGIIETELGSANILEGKRLDKGASAADDNIWNSWDDILLTVSFEIIDEVLAESFREPTGKQFLKLQMAYLLLWSAIERYTALRYKIGTLEVLAKVRLMGNEKAFVDGLRRYGISDGREIHNSTLNSKTSLNIENPKKSIEYFYQIRSNIAHRGKAVIDDAKIVHDALKQLSTIFKAVIESAKNDANR